MKIAKASLLGLLLTLCMLHTAAQNQKLPVNEPDYNKPRLFADLPAKMNLRMPDLEVLFGLTVGARVSVQATDQFLLEGLVVSTSDAPDESSKSIVIRSSTRIGATFTFTRIRNTDGTIGYIGRMISRSNGDAYTISFENGQYILEKKNLYDLVSE
jgi:hypothetical protein